MSPYSLPQHTRDHWQANRPADCAHCDDEDLYAPDVRRDYEPGAGPMRGLIITVLINATLVCAVLSVVGTMSGAYINGWTWWAILLAGITAAVVASSGGGR